jgi:hypothetical protein
LLSSLLQKKYNYKAPEHKEYTPEPKEPKYAEKEPKYAEKEPYYKTHGEYHAPEGPKYPQVSAVTRILMKAASSCLRCAGLAVWFCFCDLCCPGASPWSAALTGEATSGLVAPTWDARFARGAASSATPALPALKPLLSYSTGDTRQMSTEWRVQHA